VSNLLFQSPLEFFASFTKQIYFWFKNNISKQKMEFWVCAFDENCKHISNNAEKMRRHQRSSHTTSSNYRYAHCKKCIAVDVEDNKDNDDNSREYEVSNDEANIYGKEFETNNDEKEERNIDENDKRYAENESDIEEIIVRFLVHGHCKALFSRRVYSDTCVNDIANDVHATMFAKDVEAKPNSLFPIEGEAQQFAGALESMKQYLSHCIAGLEQMKAFVIK
jgi:hypothetical protein